MQPAQSSFLHWGIVVGAVGVKVELENVNMVTEFEIYLWRIIDKNVCGDAGYFNFM